MTAPRQIVPGRFYMVTRRCTQRMFLLRPDKNTNDIFLFCLLVAAKRSGVELIAFSTMSNHYHVVLFDPTGQVTDFVEHAHKLIARALNARWGRWENFWATEPTSIVQLVTSADVMREVIYTLSNPVAAHLVETVADWPGATSLTAMLAGKSLDAVRPNAFFRKDGPTPDRVVVDLVRPPGFEQFSQEDWNRHLLDELGRVENRARAERSATGARIRGRKALRNMSAFDKPETAEPRRKVRPEVACRNPWLRVLRLVALRAFRFAHARARQALRAGDTAVVFPFGTLKMCRIGMRCAASAV